MREALAANHDMLLDDSREQKRRGGRGAKKAAGSRLFGGRRRALVFLSFAALAAIGVPINALYLQDGRHPAPLFQKGAPAEPEARRAHVEAPPAPPPRPALEEPLPEAPAAKTGASKPAAKPSPAKPAAAKPRNDAIGALLGGSPKAGGENEKNIRQAQQALAKMGYSVHADGVMGATTRQALEKFERANGLPANGELDAAVLRRLRARAAAATPVVPAAHPAPSPARTN